MTKSYISGDALNAAEPIMRWAWDDIFVGPALEYPYLCGFLVVTHDWGHLHVFAVEGTGVLRGSVVGVLASSDPPFVNVHAYDDELTMARAVEARWPGAESRNFVAGVRARRHTADLRWRARERLRPSALANAS